MTEFSFSLLKKNISLKTCMMYRKKPMKDVRISCLKSDRCHNFKMSKILFTFV